MPLRLDDTLALILDVAHTKGTARATKIKMRREVWHLVCRDRRWPPDSAEDGMIYMPPVQDAVPIEIDQSIPIFPGFQIHREVPTKDLSIKV